MAVAWIRSCILASDLECDLHVDSCSFYDCQYKFGGSLQIRTRHVKSAGIRRWQESSMQSTHLDISICSMQGGHDTVQLTQMCTIKCFNALGLRNADLASSLPNRIDCANGITVSILSYLLLCHSLNVRYLRQTHDPGHKMQGELLFVFEFGFLFHAHSFMGFTLRVANIVRTLPPFPPGRALFCCA